MKRNIFPQARLSIALLLAVGMSAGTTASGQTPSAGDAVWQSDEVSEAERLFALVVAPALEAKCHACHGQDPDAVESGLRLDSRDFLTSGGDSGEAVLVPGDREASWLYRSATWQHDELQMPPKENDRLDAETLEALGAWIDAGAPWPTTDRLAMIREQYSSGVALPTSGGLDSTWDDRRYEPETLWAYQPLRSVEVPQHESSHPVDAFLNASMRELGIAPAGSAARRDWIRRVYFDGIGLPPTPERVEQFVRDPRSDSDARAAVVDELLSSSQFGVAAARHWLDTVRYADSAGFANDYERPNAWRYRDYVVRSFNHDKPLDEFIREQIAGDEIDSSDPEKLVAVGMLRMGPWEQTGMSVDRVTRQQFLDDVTDVVGQAFLAHPLQCARCHDHKFDPIPTRDFYRIQAVFATTQFAERDAEFLDDENRGVSDEQRRYLKQRIEHYEAVLAELNEQETAAQKTWYAERGLEYAPRKAKVKQGVLEEQIAPKKVGFGPTEYGLERIARKYLERHRWELDRYRPIALSVYSGPTPSRNGVNTRLKMPEDIAGSGKLEQTAILTGGDPFSPGTPVTPGVLSILSGVLEAGASAGRFSEGSEPGFAPEAIRVSSGIEAAPHGRRLEFAKWLTNADKNPLTPRVLVNRIWQQYFGRGLVATANNFGTAGAKPTHPELLEYLAGELVDSGWSAKHLHRLILTSGAYARSQQPADPKQLSELDPLGDSYATFRGRRLAAEEIRDAALSISGLLNDELGGPPIRPDINAEVAAQPRQIMGTYAPIYQASPSPRDRNRRTLYALRLRGLTDPMLEVFNQPSPDLPCEIRDSSTVAPQALTLFNSPLAYKRALAMAGRLLNECGGAENADRAAVIRRAFQLAFGRMPLPTELDACLEHWTAMRARHENVQLEDAMPPAEFTRQMVDENTGEQFIYTEPLEQNKDYVAEVLLRDASAAERALADVCLVLLSSNEMLYVP